MENNTINQAKFWLKFQFSHPPTTWGEIKARGKYPANINVQGWQIARWWGPKKIEDVWHTQSQAELLAQADANRFGEAVFVPMPEWNSNFILVRKQ